MQRSMDLVRELLLEIDREPQLDGRRWLPGENICVAGYSQEEIYYHLNMLIEAGYITGKIGMDAPVISKLTWQGHELLDDIRDPDIWDKTKEKAKMVSGIGVALMWELAKGELKKKLGL
jgi:DNA-binding PadR family transcriptional regulator